ncbi:MAG: co-chaperone DjlA [Gammaproteobacteria bacterium]
MAPSAGEPRFALMSWTGKLVGTLLGTVTGGPVGAVVGAFLGHQYDKGVERRSGASWAGVGRLFFETTFGVMGHVAKADGRVTEAEIDAARQIMSRMRLDPAQTAEAVRLFREGKAQDWPLEARVERLTEACGNRRSLRRAFLEIQMEAALAGGTLAPASRAVLWRVAQALELTRVDMAQIEALLRMAATGAGARSQVPVQRQSLEQAYKVLGITARTSDADAKLAYRRLMNQHHPDKLRARGMPESMIPVAEARTREIRGAWDLVRAARNLK